MGESTWRHLAARLVDVLTSRPLTATEEAECRQWLQPPEAGPFFDQPASDQRHALTCARFVASRRADRADLVRAAMLHDLGKRHARLGPIRRSLVTAWAKLGGRTKGRAAAYLGHGEAGARELTTAGADGLVADFARHHHGERPPSIPEADWDLLQQADRAPIRRKSESGSPEGGGR